jgi:hypothetical protein
VSATSLPSEQKSAPDDRSRGDDPFYNPSYPARTHYHERGKLQEALHDAEERVSAARQKLDALARDPQQAMFVRLYHQMLGARDEIAECAQRIPLEAGGLYEEDKERYKQAVAALERTWAKWQSSVGR